MVEDVSDRFKESNCYLSNTKLKRDGVKLNYTKEQIEEIIKCREDVLYFANNYIKIISLDKGLVLFDTYDFQDEMLEAMDNNRFSIFLLARQMGKCLSYSTCINIRNKTTGETREIPIGDFYQMQKETIRR